MANRLGNSTSPYLQQHRDNPVDWYEWGDEAFRAALEREVPILLSVGYSACHWCHVMAHESFEDEATAEFMNRLFVNVKVDREERPDVDAVYMEAVQAMTGRGGWPMTVWMTPEGKPFYAGTYFPREPRGGMPTFRSVMEAVSDAWLNRRSDIDQQAAQLVAAIDRSIPVAEELPGPTDLAAAYRQLEEAYDPVNGGFGHAPKFPQQPTLEFLLRVHGEPWAPRAGEMLSRTLVSMARGGIYDQLGGGFARYSVDDQWLVPHFEKMLYDNAQLARLYLWSGQALDNPDLTTIALETLEYLVRDLRHPAGGFYSAEDADSEGEEGRFYLWTGAEFDSAVPAGDQALARMSYGVSDEGNFEGRNVLTLHMTATEIADRTGHPPEEIRQSRERARRALLASRNRRQRPGLDHKVVAAWNGLAIRAFAEAGAVLARPDLVDHARSAARFVLDRLRRTDGRILRSWSEGSAKVPGFLDDHASVAVGLFALYQASGEAEWYREAARLSTMIPALFSDPAGGFFATASDAESLVKRPKDVFDNPSPSGNSLAAEALMWHSMFSGDVTSEEAARGAIRAGARIIERSPSAAGHLASVLASIHRGRREVAIVGPEPGPFLEAFWSVHRPHAVLATSAGEDNGVPLLAGRSGGHTTRAYVCEGFVCNVPATDPGQMIDQLT